MKVTNNHSRFGYKIVLIDDDPDDQSIFSSCVQEFVQELKLYSSGLDALRYLSVLPRREHPSLIVLDYQMPRMNGLETLVQLKQDPALAHIPVIIYSTETNSAMKLKAKTLGAIECFKKTTDLLEVKEFLILLGVIFENIVF